MIAAPAVDVRGGRCVQLVGGRPEEERVSLPDPVQAACRWWDAGFATLHVVDLDAALGDGDNLAVLRELAGATPAVVQVGGGVRDQARADVLLEAGAQRVIVGTRALDDPGWLEELARDRPGRIMVAADVRAGFVLRHGWTEASPSTLPHLLARIAHLPLAGVLCTDVSREGRLRGVNPRVTREAVEAAAQPVWASGGIAGVDDLEALQRSGAAGAVLGMSLYQGTLDPAEVARRWGRAGASPQGTVRNA